MTERDDDIAWIEARERGAVSDHPRAALYARLGQAIATLPELSDGHAWRDAVLAELDAEAAHQRRVRAARARRRGIVAALVSSLAIAAVVVIVVRPDPPRPVACDLTHEVGAADGTRRSGGDVAIGQPLTIRATFPARGELWIYRGDRLHLRCPGGDGCTTRSIPGGRLVEAVVRTDVALTYTALLVEGAVAAPTGSLAADAESAGPAIRETLALDVH